MHAQQQQVCQIPILLERLRTNIQGKKMQQTKSKKGKTKNQKVVAHLRFVYPYAAAAGALDPTYISKVRREKIQGRDLQG